MKQVGTLVESEMKKKPPRDVATSCGAAFWWRNEMKWFVYRVDNLDVRHWRTVGVGDLAREDITPFARSLLLLCRALGAVITPLPNLPELVCIRYGSNPFRGAYVVSPVEFNHLGTATVVELPIAERVTGL